MNSGIGITRVLYTCPSNLKTPKPAFSLLRTLATAAPVGSMSYHRELDAAKKAASLAARLCQKVQKAILQSDVQSKSDKSPVTVADYGSQAVVSFVLERELRSESFSLVAEEDSGDLQKEEAQETLQRITKLVNDTLASDGMYSASSLSAEDVLAAIDSGKSEGGPHGRHWVLDPIDGTKGFLRGDQYAVALALLDEGKVVLGVLACPNLPLLPIGSHDDRSSQDKVGCLFFSQVGAGTEVQSLDGSPPIKVHVSSTENPEEASFFESFEAAHSLHDLSSSIANKLGVKAPPVRIDSQAKYGALSRGDGAIYLRFPHKGYREKIWDHAAGAIVVTDTIPQCAGHSKSDFGQNFYYLANSICKKATNAYGGEDFWCNYCNQKVAALTKIKLNVQITDPTGTIEAAIFSEIAAEFYNMTGADATNGQLALPILHKLAEPKKCLITLKAYMHNYAGISQLKFNVHTICLDSSTETEDRSEELLVQPPNTPNKKSKKGDHDSNTSTSNPTISTPMNK